MSLVEQVLRQDPARAYAAMDFTTRDRYRKAIEALASGSTQSELVIAQHTIALAQRQRVSSITDPAEPPRRCGKTSTAALRDAAVPRRITCWVTGVASWAEIIIMPGPRLAVGAGTALVYVGGITLSTVCCWLS
jgi:hypothetical protein